MISKKDIDSRFVAQIEIAFKDIENIKDMITTLNHNDSIIEKGLQESLAELERQVNLNLEKVVASLNTVIEERNEDSVALSEELRKLYAFLELKEKEYELWNTKTNKKIDTFLDKFNKIDGYFKQEGGVLKGMDLPEDRLFAKNFHVETVTERIIEQPIIKEVEKQDTPTITKSELEHFYDYGTKLTENVMVPKHISGYDKLQVWKDPEVFYKANGKNIVLFRFIKTLLIIFLDDGTTEITNTVKNSRVFSGNIIEDIKDQLSLDISPMEITTIHPSGQGLFIATKKNGVLFYNIVNKTISTRMEDDNVIYIEDRDDKFLLVSEHISIYNSEDLRLYNSNIFANRNIKPIKVEKLVNGKIVVLTKGEQKGLDDLIYLFEFKNGELLQKFIYTDPFDTRETYFYNITSDDKTMTVIGSKDGNHVSNVYDINNLDKMFKTRVLEKEVGLVSIEHNNISDEYLLVFKDKIVLNGKVVYGLDYDEHRRVIFKDTYAYLIYDNLVERIDITVDTGNVFKFKVDPAGDGSEVKLIVKLNSKEMPVVRVADKALKTYRLLNYMVITGSVPGDTVEVNMNNSVIEDISSYHEYTLILDK